MGCRAGNFKKRALSWVIGATALTSLLSPFSYGGDFCPDEVVALVKKRKLESVIQELSQLSHSSKTIADPAVEELITYKKNSFLKTLSEQLETDLSENHVHSIAAFLSTPLPPRKPVKAETPVSQVRLSRSLVNWAENEIPKTHGFPPTRLYEPNRHEETAELVLKELTKTLVPSEPLEKKYPNLDILKKNTQLSDSEIEENRNTLQTLQKDPAPELEILGALSLDTKKRAPTLFSLHENLIEMENAQTIPFAEVLVTGSLLAAGVSLPLSGTLGGLPALGALAAVATFGFMSLRNYSIRYWRTEIAAQIKRFQSSQMPTHFEATVESNGFDEK